MEHRVKRHSFYKHLLLYAPCPMLHTLCFLPIHGPKLQENVMKRKNVIIKNSL
jgi:hypothetical protein